MEEEPKKRKRELKNLSTAMQSIREKEQRKQEKVIQLGKREAESIPSFNAFLNKQKLQRLIKFRQSNRVTDFDCHKIPDDVKLSFPQCSIYETLKDLETKIQKTISEKQSHIKENLIAPSPKIKSQLLLQIYNKHYNQDNQYTLKHPEIASPSWALHIEGKPIMHDIEKPDNEPEFVSYYKFTHFLNKVQISINGLPDIEWVKDDQTEDADGIEIIREGKEELLLTIKFYMNAGNQQYKLKDALSSLIGIRHCNKLRLTEALWEYVKYFKLQDADDKKIINCNKELAELIKEEKIEFSSLLIKLREYIEDVDPYVITYKLNLALIPPSKMFKVPISIDDPEYLNMVNFVANNPSMNLLNEPTIYTHKMTKYNEKIKATIDKIRRSSHICNFYECYSEDPLKFIQNFMLQQNSLLAIIKDDNKPDKVSDDPSSTHYYYRHENKIKEKVREFLEKEEQPDDNSKDDKNSADKNSKSEAMP